MISTFLRLHYLKILYSSSYPSQQEERTPPFSASPPPKLFSEATLTKARRIELLVKQKLEQPRKKPIPKQKRNVMVFSHLVAA